MPPQPSALPSSALTALLAIRLGEAPFDHVLQDLVTIAAESLPEADDVSITLIRGEKPFTAAHTGALSLAADELQYLRGYGPCVDAGLAGTVLVTPDMREESRWPDYAATVVPLGVLASLSIPLPIQTEILGGLNCYATKPTTWRHSGVAIELAAHIAVVVGNALAQSESARFADDMQAAMQSRSIIEQAKGVIMSQNRCDADSAFTILRYASMNRNVKLRDVAALVVESVGGPAPAGEVPDESA